MGSPEGRQITKGRVLWEQQAGGQVRQFTTFEKVLDLGTQGQARLLELTSSWQQVQQHRQAIPQTLRALCTHDDEVRVGPQPVQEDLHGGKQAFGRQDL